MINRVEKNMVYKNIIVEKKDAIGIIKINRPKVLNALDQETVKEITKAIGDLGQDKKIKVAVLTGEGKAFIAGADIGAMSKMTPLEAKDFAELGHNMLNTFEKSRLPIIAAVNGYALGGGCETLMACDIVIGTGPIGADLDSICRFRQGFKQIFIGPIVANSQYKIPSRFRKPVMRGAAFIDATALDLDDFTPLQNLKIQVGRKMKQVLD